MRGVATQTPQSCPSPYSPPPRIATKILRSDVHLPDNLLVFSNVRVNPSGFPRISLRCNGIGDSAISSAVADVIATTSSAVDIVTETASTVVSSAMDNVIVTTSSTVDDATAAASSAIDAAQAMHGKTISRSISEDYSNAR